MDENTYQENRAAALAHFQKGEFSQALAILDAIRSQFPAERAEIDYYRSCLAVRLDNPALAFQIFDALLADKVWFSEDLFRKSPSYAPLQGNEEFEKRAAAHAGLRSQSADAPGPGLHTRAPARHSPPFPLIFHLHGNGSGALAEIDHWMPALETGWLIAAPNAASAFWAGAGSFWSDHESARAQIMPHLDSLKSQFEIDSQRIIFSGFSMGGDVALAEALKGELAPACGFLLVAPGGPFLDDPQTLAPLIAAAHGRSLRGAVLLSDADPAIQPAEIEKAVQMLNEAGILTRLEKYSADGHVYPASFKDRLTNLLAWITAPQQ